MGRGQIALINAETRQLHGRRISRSGRFAPPYPIATLYVSLSVRDVPGLDENGLTLSYFFSIYGSPIIALLSAMNIFTKFRRGQPLREQ